MVSIRGAFDAIMRNWGHDILLQRRDPERKKFLPNLEKHTVRHMYPANRNLGQISQEMFEGITRPVDMLYYFRQNAHPREGDRIYEKDERFPDRFTLWRIDYSLPVRGRGGRVDYYVCGTTREEPS